MTTDPFTTAESGPGWYEFIMPGGSTAHIAYAYEDGSVYLPEGPEVVDEMHFRLAAASARFWKLARVEQAEVIIRRQERYIEELESTDAVGLKARAQQAEARIQAVKDVYDLHAPEHLNQEQLDPEDCGGIIIEDLRRALTA